MKARRSVVFFQLRGAGDVAVSFPSTRTLAEEPEEAPMFCAIAGGCGCLLPSKLRLDEPCSGERPGLNPSDQNGWNMNHWVGDWPLLCNSYLKISQVCVVRCRAICYKGLDVLSTRPLSLWRTSSSPRRGLRWRHPTVRCGRVLVRKVWSGIFPCYFGVQVLRSSYDIFWRLLKVFHCNCTSRMGLLELRHSQIGC